MWKRTCRNCSIPIRKGANIDNQDKDNDTPLMYCIENGNRNMVAFILQHKPNLELKNNKGNTAFDFCKDFGQPEILKMLEDYKNKN